DWRKAICDTPRVVFIQRRGSPDMTFKRGWQADTCRQRIREAGFISHVRIDSIIAFGQLRHDCFKSFPTESSGMQMSKRIHVWLTHKEEMHQFPVLRNERAVACAISGAFNY